MAPFDTPHATFYWSAIVNIALSCIIFKSFDVEYRDLEIWVRGHSRSLKLVPFKSLHMVCYLASIVTMTVSVAVCEIFSIKEWCDFENRVRVRSRSLEMAPFGRSHTTSYSPSIVTNYGDILYRLRDIASYRQKIEKFLYFTLFSAAGGGDPIEIP